MCDCKQSDRTRHEDALMVLDMLQQHALRPRKHCADLRNSLQQRSLVPQRLAQPCMLHLKLGAALLGCCQPPLCIVGLGNSSPYRPGADIVFCEFKFLVESGAQSTASGQADVECAGVLVARGLLAASPVHRAFCWQACTSSGRPAAKHWQLDSHASHAARQPTGLQQTPAELSVTTGMPLQRCIACLPQHQVNCVASSDLPTCSCKCPACRCR